MTNWVKWAALVPGTGAMLIGLAGTVGATAVNFYRLDRAEQKIEVLEDQADETAQSLASIEGKLDILIRQSLRNDR